MTGGDPYFDLDAGVLRNRLGITDPAELAQAEAEAELTALRLVELRRRPLPGGYDLAHLQAFHWHIFGDVYEWAGQLRKVSIGKGQLFCLPQHLETFAGMLAHAYLSVTAAIAPKELAAGSSRRSPSPSSDVSWHL